MCTFLCPDIYTAVSKKVAPVIRDSPRCTMADSYCERELQVGNK